MDIQEKFIEKSKEIVANYMFDKVGMEAPDPEDVFVVWSVKALQNCKALLGTHGSNLYFESTYNGCKGEIYFDVYNKLSNTVYEFN